MEIFFFLPIYIVYKYIYMKNAILRNKGMCSALMPPHNCALTLYCKNKKSHWL